MKYLFVVGVRPQYIKAAGLKYLFNQNGIENHEIVIYNTGQHYSKKLSTEVIEELNIHCITPICFTQNDEIFIKSLETLINYINKNGPFKIIVFGDANSTLVGSLAAYQTQSPLIHIEAGARRLSHEKEHYNSLVTDSIADLKTCLTTRAFNCLKEENNINNSIVAGDISIPYYEYLFKKHNINVTNTKSIRRKKILVTIHREFNSNQNTIIKLVSNIKTLKHDFTWIVHPKLNAIFSTISIPKNLELIDSLTHISLLRQLANIDAVITDSGGVAREAYYLRKPILMRRDYSGWLELKEIGVLDYIETESDTFCSQVDTFLSNNFNFQGNIFDIESGRKESLKLIQNLKKTKRL